MDSKEAEKLADKLMNHLEQQYRNSKEMKKGLSLLKEMIDIIIGRLDKYENLINNNHSRLNIHKEAIEQLNNLLNLFLKQENTLNEKDT